MHADIAGNDLDGGTSRANVVGGTCTHPDPQNDADGRFCAPADLVAFVAERPVSKIMAALGIGRGTAHRLRHGYWPADARRILDAWEAYKGRDAAQQSGWFLRRVHAMGVIRHAGREWTARGLELRSGQTLAVARHAGGLLAQTLELPSQRLALTLVELKPLELSH